MGTTAEKILALARGELKTTEFPPNSNKVKYNTWYYGKEVSGSAYPWCCVFVWWLFQKAGAGELFYGGKKTASCSVLLAHHKAQGQAVTAPYRAGDVIFFNFNGKTNTEHVGICESWDGTYITTIDGNTGTGNDANGGAVMERKRHKKNIVGAYRPKYGEDTDMDISKLTDKQVLELADRIDTLRGNLAPSGWSIEAREWAEQNGIVNGDESGKMKYKKNCTREELVQILYNHAKK